MQLIRNAVQSVLMVTMIGAFSSASAQERFYGGIGIGASKASVSKDSLAIAGATATTFSRSEHDTGGKIFAGYRLDSNWAVEAGYVDLGKTSARRDMLAPGIGSISHDTMNTGWFIDLVGMLPIGASDFSLIGRVGRVGSETRRNLSSSGAVTLAAGTASTSTERETNWKYGTGAQYEINKTMAARGELELYRRLGKEGSTGENEAGLFSLNLLIKFQ